jgi:hypothetical protein
MSLAETIQQKLADKTPHTGRHEWSVATDGTGWSLHLTLDRQDELGCLVWEFTLYRTAAPAGETLHAWADRVVRQATGLLEQLKVLEIDPERNEALIRSEEPSKRKGKLSYYELLLEGTRKATLRRFQASAGGTAKRDQIAFALTNEGLAKLAHDLSRD